MLALNIFLSVLALIVLVELSYGLVRGRLRLLDGNRQTNAMTYWFYVFVEAALVFLAATLWL